MLYFPKTAGFHNSKCGPRTKSFEIGGAVDSLNTLTECPSCVGSVNEHLGNSSEQKRRTVPAEFILLGVRVVPRRGEEARAGRGLWMGQDSWKRRWCLSRDLSRWRRKHVAGKIQPESLGDCRVDSLTPYPASSITLGLCHELLRVQPRLLTSLLELKDNGKIVGSLVFHLSTAM